MLDNNAKIRREKKTIKAMLRIYCKHQHGNKSKLCQECSKLLEYAMVRIDKCPLQKNKTTCARCTIHCYKPDMKEKVRDVMRFSGPRMYKRHPVLTFFHIIDGIKD